MWHTVVRGRVRWRENDCRSRVAHLVPAVKLQSSRQSGQSQSLCCPTMAIRNNKPLSTSFHSIAILLILSLCLVQPDVALGSSARKRKKRLAEKRYRKLKQDCETLEEKCGLLLPGENMNCVFKCISPTCYEAIYTDEPLEDGEVDLKRESLLAKCAKKELKLMMQRKRRRGDDPSISDSG